MNYIGFLCLCSALYTKPFVILNKLLLLDIDFTMSNLYMLEKKIDKKSEFTFQES